MPHEFNKSAYSISKTPILIATRCLFWWIMSYISNATFVLYQHSIGGSRVNEFSTGVDDIVIIRRLFFSAFAVSFMSAGSATISSTFTKEKNTEAIFQDILSFVLPCTISYLFFVVLNSIISKLFYHRFLNITGASSFAVFTFCVSEVIKNLVLMRKDCLGLLMISASKPTQRFLMDTIFAAPFVILLLVLSNVNISSKLRFSSFIIFMSVVNTIFSFMSLYICVLFCRRYFNCVSMGSLFNLSYIEKPKALYANYYINCVNGYLQYSDALFNILMRGIAERNGTNINLALLKAAESIAHMFSGVMCGLHATEIKSSQRKYHAYTSLTPSTLIVGNITSLLRNFTVAFILLMGSFIIMKSSKVSAFIGLSRVGDNMIKSCRSYVFLCGIREVLSIIEVHLLLSFKLSGHTRAAFFNVVCRTILRAFLAIIYFPKVITSKIMSANTYVISHIYLVQIACIICWVCSAIFLGHIKPR